MRDLRNDPAPLRPGFANESRTREGEMQTLIKTVLLAATLGLSGCSFLYDCDSRAVEGTIIKLVDQYRKKVWSDVSSDINNTIARPEVPEWLIQLHKNSGRSEEEQKRFLATMQNGNWKEIKVLNSKIKPGLVKIAKELMSESGWGNVPVDENTNLKQWYDLLRAYVDPEDIENIEPLLAYSADVESFAESQFFVVNADAIVSHLQDGKLSVNNVKTLFKDRATGVRECTAELEFDGAMGVDVMPIEYKANRGKTFDVLIDMPAVYFYAGIFYAFKPRLFQ